MRCLGKNVAMSYGDGRGFLYSEGMAALLENEYGSESLSDAVRSAAYCQAPV